MEFDKNTVIVGIVILIIIAIGIYFYRKRSNGTITGTSVTESSSNEATIYGSMTCPYTVKQIEKYPGYKFVDCYQNKCPHFVTAFPTTKHEDGKIEVGFS